MNPQSLITSIRRYTKIGHDLTAEGPKHFLLMPSVLPADLNVERMSKQTLFRQFAETQDLGQNSQIESRAEETNVLGNSELSIEDAQRLIEIVHREIHYEHGLISNRMSWYVTSQSFLMAAFAVVGGYMHSFPWLAKWFIPPLGMLISVVTLVSIGAAIRVMSELRNEEKCLRNKHDPRSPFKLLRKHTHVMGLLPPVSVPLLFLIAWLMIWLKISSVV